MPITPLHLGLMGPIFLSRHKRKAWIALSGFTLINLWIDQNAITAWINRGPLPSHDHWLHTLPGALICAVLLALPAALPYLRSSAWIAGTLAGAITHIVLDGLVHPEIQPFAPIPWNPLYAGPGAMQWVSAILAVLTVLLIALCVSDAMRWARGVGQRHRETAASRE